MNFLADVNETPLTTITLSPSPPSHPNPLTLSTSPSPSPIYLRPLLPHTYPRLIAYSCVYPTLLISQGIDRTQVIAHDDFLPCVVAGL
jgi:hypothetical protein